MVPSIHCTKHGAGCVQEPPEQAKLLPQQVPSIFLTQVQGWLVLVDWHKPAEQVCVVTVCVPEAVLAQVLAQVQPLQAVAVCVAQVRPSVLRVQVQLWVSVLATHAPPEQTRLVLD